MTKEQAIETLRHRTNLGYGIVIENESTQVIEEALETVIEALEQQPSEDCVSRQAVKDIIHHYKNNIECQTSYLTDGVCNLPSVKPISNLDKIRAEIEQGYCVVNNDYDHGRNYGLYMATQIIDKYKAESEVKE